MVETTKSIVVLILLSYRGHLAIKASTMAVFRIVTLLLCLTLGWTQTFPDESQTLQRDEKLLVTESVTLENRNEHSTILMETTDMNEFMGNTSGSRTMATLMHNQQFKTTGSSINGENVANSILATSTNELSHQSETTTDPTVPNGTIQNEHATNSSMIIHCENFTLSASFSANNSKCQTDESKADEVKPKPKVDYIGYITTPIFFFVGIIGNSLTVFVMLRRPFRQMSVSVALISLSLSDLAVSIMFPFNKMFVRNLITRDVRALDIVGCRTFFWAFRLFKIMSSWCVVLISSERFVAVWIPNKAKSINTKRNIAAAIASLFLFFTCYIGYWTNFADKIIKGVCIPNTRPPGQELKAGVFLVLGLSFVNFIPAVLLIVLNTLIVARLFVMARPGENNFSKDIKPIKHRDSKTKAMVMLIAVAIMYVILVTPITVAHLVFFILDRNIFEATQPGFVLFRDIAQTMEQLNFSINFFLYVLCSKGFRRNLLQALGLKYLQNQVQPASTVNNATENTMDKNLPSSVTHH